jgi:excisionase family DNA binding protein
VVNIHHDKAMSADDNSISRQTYTLEEAAKLLGVGRNQAYDAAKRGQIPVLKIGRRLLVPKAALNRMLSGGEAA